MPGEVLAIDGPLEPDHFGLREPTVSNGLLELPQAGVAAMEHLDATDHDAGALAGQRVHDDFRFDDFHPRCYLPRPLNAVER